MLVGLGIVASPIIISISVLPTYLGIFSDGTWEALTTQGGEAYSPLWAPILIIELGINAALVLAWMGTAYLFFTKKAVFTKAYISLVAFSVAFILGDALAIGAVMPDEPVFDPDTTTEFVRACVFALVWISYMLTSRRVKSTFVR